MTDPHCDAPAPARRGPLPRQEPLTGGDVPILYKLSDADLKERAEAGNEEAEIVLQDRVIVRGLVSNDPTYTDQHWTWLDTQLCLHFKRLAVPPHRVRLILKINESITGEFFELHWSEVRRWQKFLRNLQGPEPSVTVSTPLQENLSVSGNGAPPWLRLDRDSDKRPYVSILLNDTIKVPEIKRCWEWVRLWQRFLREEYGPAPYTDDSFLSRLNTLHKNGLSYAMIARRVEEEAFSRLERRMYHLRGAYVENLAKADEWTADEARHYLEGFSAGLYGLRVLGYGRADVSDWLRLTLRSIAINGMARLERDKVMARLRREKVPDWSTLSPLAFVLNREAITPIVDREKVIHALRKFKNRGKKGLGVRTNRKRSN